MKRLLNQLSYANVMATIAVFIALGGASYAAIEVPKNSVGSKQLKNGAVTQAKLGKAVKKSLSKAGVPGPVGPAGAPGAAGSARGYVYIDTDGKFDPSKSKGVIDVRPACGGGPECTSPPPAGASTDYCFNLDFTPTVVVATPAFGRSYAPDGADTVDARIPSRQFSETYGGCAPEYRDAEVRAYQLESLEPGAGLFVMFN